MVRKRNRFDDLVHHYDPSASLPEELNKREQTAFRKLKFPFSEADLLKGLTAYTAHADEAAKLMTFDLEPLQVSTDSGDESEET